MFLRIIVVLITVGMLIPGCNLMFTEWKVRDLDSDSTGGSDGDTDADTDSDGDTDSDTDADSDGDTDADTDTDTDSDGDTDSDTDTDSVEDTDTGTDSGTDTADTDTNWGIEPPAPLPGNASTGFAMRYWDCCKPSCAWSANVPDGTPAKSCDVTGVAELENSDAASACGGGSAPAYQCYDFAPRAVGSRLAYGYGVTYSADSNECGNCYQIDFTGESHVDTDPGAVSLTGKTMIVQVISVGSGITGEFDLLIPGGGIGGFAACSTQWGTVSDELGEPYGGWLSDCQEDHPGDLTAQKSCVMGRCEAVFNTPGMQDLLDGCGWFVSWFGAASVPELRYAKIDCPQELMDRSGLER